MISLKSKNDGFSKVYRVKTQNYNKIVKIYNQNAFTHFFREDLKKSKKFYNSINYLKITPFHKILSEHIIEIDEINSDKSLNKKEFFSNKNLLDQFKAQIGIISEIKQNLINKKLIDEIKNYLDAINSNTNKSIKVNIKKLESYINRYPQNKICHGDIHFQNLIISKKKLLFIDWDYRIKSSLGYDLAMFSYLEKFNKRQKEYLSQIFKISIAEIEHYTPICELLDYLYQNILYKLNLIKNVDKSLIAKNKDFILNIL